MDRRLSHPLTAMKDTRYILIRFSEGAARRDSFSFCMISTAAIERVLYCHYYSSSNEMIKSNLVL